MPQSTEKHEALYRDVCMVLDKHAKELPAEECLALVANIVGKVLAFQDQRTMDKERAMAIIARNIEIGNQHVIQEMMNSQGGLTCHAYQRE
jgi:hypothetical protein